MKQKVVHIWSKLETREESGHFIKSKTKSSSVNYPQILNNNINFIKNNNLKQKNFTFLKFDKLNHKLKISSKKKILNI